MLNWLLDNLYWIIPGLVLLWIWSKIRRKEAILVNDKKKVELKDLAIIFEVGLLIFLVYLTQSWLFPEHWFFIIALLIFIPVMGAIFYWLLSLNDIYILETAIQGQELLDIKNGHKIFVPRTSNALYKMDRKDYQSKDHVGDLKTPYWDFDKLKFVDYYDKDKNTFYHAEYSTLKNITFYQAKAIWLKLLDVVPKVQKKNIELTVLGEMRIGHALKQMIKEIPWHLDEIARQHPDPFNLADMEDLLQKARKDGRYKDIDTQVRDIMAEVKEAEGQESEGA